MRKENTATLSPPGAGQCGRKLQRLAERQPKHNYLRIPKRPMISTYPWGLTLRR